MVAAPTTLSVLVLSQGVALEGGFPIVVDGKLIGAIGVSGGIATQDGVTAKARLDAVTCTDQEMPAGQSPPAFSIAACARRFSSSGVRSSIWVAIHHILPNASLTPPLRSP